MAGPTGRSPDAGVADGFSLRQQSGIQRWGVVGPLRSGHHGTVSHRSPRGGSDAVCAVVLTVPAISRRAVRPRRFRPGNAQRLALATRARQSAGLPGQSAADSLPSAAGSVQRRLGQAGRCHRQASPAAPPLSILAPGQTAGSTAPGGQGAAVPAYVHAEQGAHRAFRAVRRPLAVGAARRGP
ncbi:hypothetical protein D3C76_931930 [compost metagenome]